MTDGPDRPRPIEIIADGDEIAAWLAATWPYGTSGPPFATAGTPVTISVRRVDVPFWSGLRDGAALPGTAGTWHHRVDPCTFWSWESGDDRAPSDGASIVGFRLDDDGITIDAYGEPFRAWSALTNAFHEAIALSGVVAFHAAAVGASATAAAPPQTWLLLGRGGDGKTTTLLRAVHAGWTPIAEDMCWLDPSTLEVIGSDTTVGVRPGSRAVLRSALPEAAGRPLHGRADPKVRIPWGELGEPRHPWPVTHVAELRRGDAHPPGSAPSTPLRTAMALHQAGGIPRTDRVRTLLSTAIGHLVARTQPLRLTLGDLDRPFP